jgi:hypothetical protein
MKPGVVSVLLQTSDNSPAVAVLNNQHCLPIAEGRLDERIHNEGFSTRSRSHRAPFGTASHRPCSGQSRPLGRHWVVLPVHRVADLALRQLDKAAQLFSVHRRYPLTPTPNQEIDM